MELSEQIRREYEYGGGPEGLPEAGHSSAHGPGTSAQCGPAERKRPVRESPKLEPARAFVEAILEADRRAPRKQRHTAHRIWSRIRAELPEVEVAECTIRRYVRKRKMELRLVGQEPFVPQSYRWGEEAQVDWYEAYADIAGERENAHVFCMRSMASGGAFQWAGDRLLWRGIQKASL